MKTIKVHIAGLVQGVFFRKFIKDEADKLKLKGYVRNLEDGRVEAIFEGQAQDIDKIIEVCRQGAPESKVQTVDVEIIGHQGFKNFKVSNI